MKTAGMRCAGWTWDPPKCGATMPDGRSRIIAVTIDEPDARGVSPVEVGLSLAGQVRYRAWPCTNRRAKRQRCKARRRVRKAVWHVVHRPLLGVAEEFEAAARAWERGAGILAGEAVG